MGRALKAMLLLLLPVLVGALPPDGKDPIGTPAAKLASIRQKLEKGEIGRVEIVYYPEDALTAVALTPAALERQYAYKLTVGDLRVSPYGRELREILKGTRVQPAANRGDLRWGVVFFALDGARLGGIYLDNSGRRGSVDDAPVSVDPGLHRFLKASFGAVFR